MPNFVLEDIFIVDKENNEQNHNEFHRLSKSHWLKDYAADIFESMMEAEKRRRPIFYLSPQLTERKKMLQLCQHVASTYKSTRCALHLSIYYMDRFVDFYKIRQDKLYLVTLVCFHIASQIENIEASVPRYQDMDNMLKNMNGMSYAPCEYKAVERKVLTHFDFELIRPTTANFVELLACSFLTRSEFAAYKELCEEHPEYERYGSFHEMLADQARTLLLLADYTLNIHRFGNEPPSLMAAVCIAAVRQFCCLPQRWTPHLTQLTSYTESVIEPYVEILTLYHYYKKTSEERLNSFLNELEEDNKNPDTCVDYPNLSNTDSGLDTTMPNEIEKIETVNIISVKQIKKPNADYPPGKDDEKPTRTHRIDENHLTYLSINTMKPSNDNETRKPNLKRKSNEERSSGLSLDDTGLSLDTGSGEEFPIFKGLLEPTPKKHCGQHETTTNFYYESDSD